MITLTSAFLSPYSLGGASGTTYDIMDIVAISFDVVNKTVIGVLNLKSSGTPAAPILVGSFAADVGDTAQLSASIPMMMGWSSSASLTGTQKTLLLTGIANAQNGFENAMINVGIMTGVQTTGL